MKVTTKNTKHTKSGETRIERWNALSLTRLYFENANQRLGDKSLHLGKAGSATPPYNG